ncbi:MAG TPA: hypothetical protein VG916_01740 [Gemmatimonadaceae bacterium]|nr:hypothetical protein [Gemmatimonadaceae bacterium]
MPVTARLSQRFYEKLGDEVANELVEWFNAVDATYRSDLRAINESNFVLFDTKVEQRFAESDAKFARRLAEFEARMTAFEARIEQRITQLDRDLRVHIATSIAELRSSLMTWIVGLWITSALGFAGIILAIARLR